MDLGGGRRGVDMGPSAIRIAGLAEGVRSLGLDFVDCGNVPVREPESLEPQDPRAHFLDEIADCCRALCTKVEGLMAEDCLPLIVGGDHSIACGTIAGISTHFHRRGQRIGLIWFDAHGDMNTPETSESGNIHGMPLAACLGYGPDALTRLGERFPYVDVDRAVLVGVRSLDKGERRLVHDSGITCFTMRDIDAMGIHRVMEQALEVVTHGTAGFHLSFDVDGADPSVAPGVGTPVRGGTSYRESHSIMEHVAESGHLLGLELTEINPILDERNATAKAAVELALSALGKSIL
jgi:arginase